MTLSLVTSTVLLSAPLILAAMGGYTSERAGVVNIALEGKMLAAACTTALVAPAYGVGPALVCGIFAAVTLSLLHWLMTQYYRLDHVISGMAINALAAGGTNFLYGRFADKDASSIPKLSVWWFCAVAFALPLLLMLYTKRTRGGLRLLSVGSDPEKARLVGVEPVRVRFFGLLATGVFTGLGGAMLVTDAGHFTDNMTAGRGYIALAALILGGWRPVPALYACIGFGFFSALRLVLQGAPTFGIDIPSQAWAALPYVVTIVALAGFLGRNRTPAGLQKQ